MGDTMDTQEKYPLVYRDHAGVLRLTPPHHQVDENGQVTTLVPVLSDGVVTFLPKRQDTRHEVNGGSTEN
jgi:hypothetical protein